MNCPNCLDDHPDEYDNGKQWYCTNCGLEWRPDRKPLKVIDGVVLDVLRRSSLGMSVMPGSELERILKEGK